MNTKIILGLLFIVSSSIVSFANSYLAKTDLTHMYIDKQVVLQDQKLELSRKELDGYNKMLEMKNIKLSKNIYTPDVVVVCK